MTIDEVTVEVMNEHGLRLFTVDGSMTPYIETDEGVFFYYGQAQQTRFANFGLDSIEALMQSIHEYSGDAIVQSIHAGFDPNNFNALRVPAGTFDRTDMWVKTGSAEYIPACVEIFVQHYLRLEHERDRAPAEQISPP